MVGLKRKVLDRDRCESRKRRSAREVRWRYKRRVHQISLLILLFCRRIHQDHRKLHIRQMSGLPIARTFTLTNFGFFQDFFLTLDHVKILTEVFVDVHVCGCDDDQFVVEKRDSQDQGSAL